LNSGTNQLPERFFYTFSHKDGEAALCKLEQRSVFGVEASEEGGLLSHIRFDPSRSPFIRQRLSVLYETDSLEELVRLVDGLEAGQRTFKVRYVKTERPVDYGEQRRIEARLGAVIRGLVDVREPGILYGVAQAGGSWLFGVHESAEAVWLRHQNKPQGYSTALNTRVARAVVNMAIPDGDTSGRTLVDPCCGIGTVLVEALSMGIDAVGSDLNPLAVKGARINLAHYGLPNVVKVQDVSAVQGSFTAAVVDLPYNLCSVSPPEEQLRILHHVRTIAERAVIVTTEDVDGLLAESGFRVTDCCGIPKGKLLRKVLVCE
jgi:16S rRNA G966 N2-methylase RsmD